MKCKPVLMGVVADAVFTTGPVIDWKTRELRIYYGAADTCIALADGGCRRERGRMSERNMMTLFPASPET